MASESTIPEPVAGLVVRYEFVRFHEAAEGYHGKERPSCVAFRLARDTFVQGLSRTDEGSPARPGIKVHQGQVILLPIQSDPPSGVQVGFALTPEAIRAAGLTEEKSAYLIVSEFNVDDWPSAGLRPATRGKSGYVQGRLPPGTVTKMVEMFREAVELGKAKSVTFGR